MTRNAVRTQLPGVVSAQGEIKMASVPNDIVFYHYSFSPYARRVVWYLTLRRLEYAQCLQPAMLPRPDLKSLGVKYRRIPVMAIGRDVYCDTRLMLKKLEHLFPEGAIGASEGDEKAIQRLLDRYMTDAGIFMRAASLMPPNLPIFSDQQWLKDRTDLTGRAWSKEKQESNRLEALSHIKDVFDLLETTLLADGRAWVLKTTKPSLADIEAIWPLHWLLGLPGAIPSSVASEDSFPKVFAWVKRFDAALKEASSSVPKAIKLKGSDATDHVLGAEFVEKSDEVDPTDPLGLQADDMVEVFPIDTGFNHKDQGRLRKLTSDEVVIEVSTDKGKSVHLHMPRWGYRIRKVNGSRI